MTDIIVNITGADAQLTVVQVANIFVQAGDEAFHDPIEATEYSVGGSTLTDARIKVTLDQRGGGRLGGMVAEIEHFLGIALEEHGIDADVTAQPTPSDEEIEQAMEEARDQFEGLSEEQIETAQAYIEKHGECEITGCAHDV